MGGWVGGVTIQPTSKAQAGKRNASTQPSFCRGICYFIHLTIVSTTRFCPKDSFPRLKTCEFPFIIPNIGRATIPLVST